MPVSYLLETCSPYPDADINDVSAYASLLQLTGAARQSRETAKAIDIMYPVDVDGLPLFGMESGESIAVIARLCRGRRGLTGPGRIVEDEEKSIAGVWIMKVDELMETDPACNWVLAKENCRAGVDADGLLWGLDHNNNWVAISSRCDFTFKDVKSKFDRGHPSNLPSPKQV